MPWDNARLAKAEKCWETKLIQDLEAMPQKQKQRSYEKLRYSMPWGGTVPVPQKKKRVRLTEDSYLIPVSAAQPSSILSCSTHTYILVNEKKIKETDYVFVHQFYWLSLLYTAGGNAFRNVGILLFYHQLISIICANWALLTE